MCNKFWHFNGNITAKIVNNLRNFKTNFLFHAVRQYLGKMCKMHWDLIPMAVRSETRLTGSSVFRIKVLGVAWCSWVLSATPSSVELEALGTLGADSLNQWRAGCPWEQTEAMHTSKTIPVWGLIDKENLRIISLVYPLDSMHSLVYYCNRYCAKRWREQQWAKLSRIPILGRS